MLWTLLLALHCSGAFQLFPLDFLHDCRLKIKVFLSKHLETSRILWKESCFICRKAFSNVRQIYQNKLHSTSSLPFHSFIDVMVSTEFWFHNPLSWVIKIVLWKSFNDVAKCLSWDLLRKLFIELSLQLSFFPEIAFHSRSINNFFNYCLHNHSALIIVKWGFYSLFTSINTPPC